VAVRKKDGTLRICVDYRALNDKTIPLQGEMPRVDGAWDKLKSKRFFSLIDLKAGYNQVRMSPDAARKAAFLAPPPFGLLEPAVLPFGLKNAPAMFQQLMWAILGDLEYVYVYMDDILIASETLEQHAEHVEEVLKRLRERNLYLNVKKCFFGKRRIHHLGHIIGEGEIRPDPEKVAAVRDAVAPKNVKQLQAFLGLANFYRPFLGEKVADISEPLNQLLKKSAKWDWTAACEQAFQELKGCLTSDAVLSEGTEG
jgi:hypothetical protein